MCWEQRLSLPAFWFFFKNTNSSHPFCVVLSGADIFLLSIMFVFTAQWASDECASPLNEQMLIKNNKKKNVCMLELLPWENPLLLAKWKFWWRNRERKRAGKKKKHSHSSPAAEWVMSEHSRVSPPCSLLSFTQQTKTPNGVTGTQRIFRKKNKKKKKQCFFFSILFWIVHVESLKRLFGPLRVWTQILLFSDSNMEKLIYWICRSANKSVKKLTFFWRGVCNEALVSIFFF